MMKEFKNTYSDLKTTCIEKLITLAANITAEDKQDAMVACEISRPTLDKYLTGEVTKIETAISLIEFLTERFNQRIKVLKASLT